MGLLAGEVERTPSKEIGVPGRIVDDCGYVRPLVGGVALFAMRLPLLDGRPKGGVCDAVSECSHVDVLLVCVQFQARGAPFPMSARKLIPVADKLDDRMTRHGFALHFADDAARWRYARYWGK